MFQYRFTLTFDATSYTVTPVWPGTLSKDFETEKGQYFKRDKLSGTLIFKHADFDLINNATFGTEFEIKIEQKPGNGSYSDYWLGRFTKPDCEFNVDDSEVVVRPQPKDRYYKLLAAMDNEYDLLALNPERSTVLMKKQPLFQLYLPGSDFLMNLIGDVYWEEPVTPESNTGTLTGTYHFSASKSFIFIPGAGQLDPDVSGEYDVGSGLRTDGVYRIQQQFDPGDTHWAIIEVSSGSKVYRGVKDEALHGTPAHYAAGTLLTATGPSGDTCRAYLGEFYGRYFTDKQVTGWQDIPDPDLSTNTYGYNYVVPYNFPDLNGSDTNQTAPTRYGKFGTFAEGVIHFSPKYFGQLILPGGEKTYPIVNTEWTAVSYWFNYTATTRTLQEDSSVDITIYHAYKLIDVLAAFLLEIDNTVTIQEATAYSDFFHGLSNPIRTTPLTPVITPKTNVIVGDYDQPARLAKIRLKEVFELLMNFHNVFWYIDDSNRLILEHRDFFDNGKQYTTQNIGLDITALLDPKSETLWSHHTNSYKFDKEQIPQRMEFSWMDEVSPPFEGFPIVMTSKYVQDGLVEDHTIAKFTSDIDYGQAVPSDISKDGFFFLECENQEGNLVVPFLEFTLDVNNVFKMQNGHASFLYGHDKYMRHGLPTKDVTLNEQAVTATTIRRWKVQDIIFPAQTFDIMTMIKTTVGTGLVRELKENLQSGDLSITIEHDTE